MCKQVRNTKLFIRKRKLRAYTKATFFMKTCKSLKATSFSHPPFPRDQTQCRQSFSTIAVINLQSLTSDSMSTSAPMELGNSPPPQVTFHQSRSPLTCSDFRKARVYNSLLCSDHRKPSVYNSATVIQLIFLNHVLLKSKSFSSVSRALD